jgi:hypothetical protein
MPEPETPVIFAVIVERTKAQARLAYLISKRMRDAGENYALAELNVVRTDEGLALWNQVRRERLEPSERVVI